MAETKGADRGWNEDPHADHSADPGVGGRSRAALLECRIEMMEASYRGALAEADSAREKLAESAAREAEISKSRSELQQELAEARAEILALHRRLDRSEAMRSEMESRLLRAGGAGVDADGSRQNRENENLERRIMVKDRAIENLRSRLDEVLASRDFLFSRIVEWQGQGAEEGDEVADLAEFIAELRAEILSLESEKRAFEATVVESPAIDQEDRSQRPVLEVDDDVEMVGGPVECRDEDERASAFSGMVARQSHRFRAAGVDAGSREHELGVSSTEPRGAAITLAENLAGEIRRGDRRSRLRAAMRLLEMEPGRAATPLAEEISSADDPAYRAGLLLLLAKTKDQRAIGVIRPWISAPEAPVRAAAFEAACRLLDQKGEGAASYLRAGLADPDPIVRRRCILAATAARSVACRPLLEPLRQDPDRKVRDLIRSVFAKLPPAVEGEVEDVVLALTLASTRAT